MNTTVRAAPASLSLRAAEAYVDQLFERVVDGRGSFAEMLAAVTIAERVARMDLERVSEVLP